MPFKIDIKKFNEELQMNDWTTWEKVYKHCKKYCYTTLKRRRNLQESDIENIYHDAMLRLIDIVKNNTFPEIHNPCAYIYRICELIDKNRKKYQEKIQKIRSVIAQNNHYNEDDSDETLSGKVKKSFNMLKEKCQNVLKLFYLWGYSMEEIAEDLGYANGPAVKATKYACRKKWVEYFKSL